MGGSATMYRNLPFNGSSFSRSRAPWPAPGPEGGGCSARRRRRPRWMRIAESHPAEGPLRFHPLLNCTCIIYPNLVILQHFWGLWNWGIRARSLLVNAREKQKKFYENMYRIRENIEFFWHNLKTAIFTFRPNSHCKLFSKCLRPKNMLGTLEERH